MMPRKRSGDYKPGENLERALSRARKEARELVKSVPGGRDDNGRPWHYAPTDEVMREATRLLDKHHLEIRFVGQRLTCGNVRTRYKVLHLPSMDFEVIRLEAPPFCAGPLGVAWTLEHSRRLIRLHVLQLRTADEPQLQAAAPPPAVKPNPDSTVKAEGAIGTFTTGPAGKSWRRQVLDAHRAAVNAPPRDEAPPTVWGPDDSAGPEVAGEGAKARD
jgi:hypothetical protein